MPDYPADGSLITTAAGLRGLVDHLRDSGRFGFDTEFVSESTFEPVLGLIQVATRETLALIDPLALRDLSPFWEVVTDPNIEVVMHAAGEDLRICHLQAGRLPRRVVDVQIAAALVGYGYPISLNHLVRQELGITLTGGETRADWRRRPLNPAQMRYALDDVRHLLDLADCLGAELSVLGRAEWAEAEYLDRIGSVEARADEEDRWRRLPGLHQLSRRGLEIARRMVHWRREQARKQDRPIRQVLRDDLLVAIAKRQPANQRELESIRDFNRPHLHSHAREFLDIVAEAGLVPPEQLPEHLERHEERPGMSIVVSMLSAALSQSCAQKRVAASLVGSNNDLKDLIRWYSDGAAESRRPELARGWRGEVCGQTLLDVLSGRRALRVADPTAEMPVALDPIPEPGAES